MLEAWGNLSRFIEELSIRHILNQQMNVPWPMNNVSNEELNEDEAPSLSPSTFMIWILNLNQRVLTRQHQTKLDLV